MDNLADGAVGADAFDDEEVHADRRSNQGELHVDEHHDVEPDEVKAQRFDNRIEHRQRDEDDGDRFEHAAEGQEDEVDADEDNPAADLCVRDERHQGLRCLQGCQDEAEQHGADHDGENHRGRLDRVLQDFAHIAELYRAINKERDNQAVERADGSGFGRREEAGVDTADDDNRQQQAPDIFLERCHALLPAGCRLALHVAAAENEVADEEEGHENARYNTRNEELADRLTRDGAVKNHRDARRNQDAERAARGDGAEDGRAFIAALEHFRNGHGANRDGRGYARARDCGENGTGENRRDADAARQMAEPFAAELKEAVADFAFEQNLTHEDVQRHGDEHEVVEGLIGDDRNLRKRGRTAEEKEHAEHTAEQ